MDHVAWGEAHEENYQNYHDMDANTLLYFSHRIGYDLLIEYWSHLTYALSRNKHSILYLQIDYTNAYCAIGCCRMLSGGLEITFTLKAKTFHVLGIKSSSEEEAYVCGSRVAFNAESEYTKDIDNEDMITRHGIVCNPEENVWAKWKKYEGSGGDQSN